MVTQLVQWLYQAINKAFQVMHKEGYPLFDYSGYRALLNIKSESQVFLCQILTYAH